jgi:phospholipase/carboxylesterase
VLENVPEPDLSGTRVLMVTGQSDPYGPYAAELEALLSHAGASVENRLLPAGHDIGAADADLARQFMEKVVR